MSPGDLAVLTVGPVSLRVRVTSIPTNGRVFARDVETHDFVGSLRNIGGHRGKVSVRVARLRKIEF